MNDHDNQNNRPPPTLNDLQVRLAVAIEQLRHLTSKVDERYESIKRLHDRMDSTDKMKEDIAELRTKIDALSNTKSDLSNFKHDNIETQTEIKVKLSILEKLVYVSLGLGVSGVGVILWAIIQKFLGL